MLSNSQKHVYIKLFIKNKKNKKVEIIKDVVSNVYTSDVKVKIVIFVIFL